MSWRDLIDEQLELTLPWTGGHTLRAGPRSFRLAHLPTEHGWYIFRITGRDATLLRATHVDDASFTHRTVGYLVGDLLLPDDPAVGRSFCPLCRGYLASGPHFLERACGTCHTRTVNAVRLHLVEPHDRFVRVEGGRVYEDGPFIFTRDVFPLGAEDEVRSAFEDNTSICDIKGVTPALEAASLLEVWHRDEAARRRAELAARRRAEEERRTREARRAQLIERIGDGQGRRELAQIDFGEAARAALAVGGAVYLDHRKTRDEYTVRYRIPALARRFECVVDATMQVIDAGICLADHRTGEKGDTYFTLESLPAVVVQADNEDKLVVWRHV